VIAQVENHNARSLSATGKGGERPKRNVFKSSQCTERLSPKDSGSNGGALKEKEEKSTNPSQRNCGGEREKGLLTSLRTCAGIKGICINEIPIEKLS